MTRTVDRVHRLDHGRYMHGVGHVTQSPLGVGEHVEECVIRGDRRQVGVYVLDYHERGVPKNLRQRERVHAGASAQVANECRSKCGWTRQPVGVRVVLAAPVGVAAEAPVRRRQHRHVHELLGEAGELRLVV